MEYFKYYIFFNNYIKKREITILILLTRINPFSKKLNCQVTVTKAFTENHEC